MMDKIEEEKKPVKKKWFANRDNRLWLIELVFQRFNFFIISSTALWTTYLFYSSQYKGIANSITELLSKYWIKPILSKIGTGDIPILLLILLVVLIILFIIGKGMRRYVYSRKTIAICAVVILNYILLRWIDTPYKFSCFLDDGFFSNLAYWDVIYLLFVPIIFRISGVNNNKAQKKKSNVSVKSSFLSDDPVKKDEDIFPERISIAGKFSDSIKAIQAKSSYAIGISSPWGNGKTTFLRYLLKKLKEKDNEAIFIEFSPWFCKTEADIISLFFDSLSDGLKAYHSSINNQLQKYAKIILSLRKNTFTESIGKALNIFEESKELHSIYKELNKHIGSLNRKIYISIDDLDRLYAKEIIECFKIIRNTANFKNIIFIVAYDADYVDKALKEALKENHKNYIDKIIQLEYALPEIESSALIQFIKTKLGEAKISQTIITRILTPTYREFQNSNNVQDKLVKLDIESYFANVRDCIRILNLFFTQKKNLESEVLLPDLFLVCILKTLYPDEALKIYLNLDDHFKVRGDIQLKDVDEFKNFALSENDKSVKTEPRYLIKELNSDKGFFNLIQAIFFTQNPNVLSSSFRDNYETYYNGAISERKVSYADFKEWLKSINELKNQIAHLSVNKNDINDDKLSDLESKLSRYRAKDKDEAQVMVHALFYLQDEFESGIQYDSILSVLRTFKEDCIYILKNIIETSNEVRLIHIASMIHVVKLAYMRKGKNKSYPLILKFDNAFESLHSLSLKLLNKKIEDKKIDGDLFDIYFYCTNKYGDNDKFVIDSNANEMMNTFATLNENKVRFLKNLEIKKREFDGDDLRVFRPFLDQIFTNEIGNYDGFERFFKDVVMENPNNSELEQIWNYWEKYKASNYKSYHIEQ